MSMRVTRLLALAAVLDFVPSVNTAQVATRDSAGIRILEFPATSLAGLAQWKLVGPTLRIGDAMGEAEYLFNNAAFPYRLADGRIVVANDQQELRFYSRSGRYLATAGRRGRGPGEYQQLLIFWRVAGDTLRAYDPPSSRVDVRADDGRLVRAMPFPLTTQVAWLSDGAAVYASDVRPDISTPGIRRGAVAVRRLTSAGIAAETLAVLPGSWSDVTAPGYWRGVALAGAPMLSSGGDAAVFVHGDQMTLYWFGPTGHVRSVSRVLLPSSRPSADDIRAEEARRTALTAGRPPLRTEPGPRSAPVYATALPQVSRVRLDSEGRAWVRRWSRWGVESAEWIVFARFGGPIARVAVPARLAINDVGADYLVGIMTDDEGVQTVEQYAIRHRE